jgi:VWFA-related protein
VRGLTKEDFIVLEDGVPQNVTNFSAYESGTATVAGVSDAQQEPAREKGPPRHFVFFVDEMGVQKKARQTLIRHATQLVDQMRDGDKGAVIRPLGEQRIAQNFTTDTAAVRKALTEALESSTIRGNRAGMEIRDLQHAYENADVEGVSGEGDRAFARGRYIASMTDRVRQRLSQLRALVASMSGLEGRKVIVLITAGLSSHPGREMKLDYTSIGLEWPVNEWGKPGDDFTPIIDELARTAAANGITFYALEPEVPLTMALRKTAASKNVGTTEGSGHVSAQDILPAQMMEQHLHYRGQTLTSLAQKTGGAWFRGIATIDDVFRQVSSDLQVYYSLAYRAKGETDKPRRISVSIRNRPELHVRTRTEVVDRSPEREMGDLTAANLLFPRALNELDVAVLTYGPPTRGLNFFTIPVDVVIPLQTLTFVQSDDDKYTAVIDVHFSAAALKNDFTTAGRHRQNIEISAEQYEERETVTYRFKTGIEVPRGPSRIAIGVMDTVSRLAGFGNLDVNPN